MEGKEKARAIIGIKNHDAKKRLREQVKAGSAKVEWAYVDDRHTCFFCLERIAGTAQILVEEDEQNRQKRREYPVCDPCYISAKYF